MPKPPSMFQPLKHKLENVELRQILPPLPNAATRSSTESATDFGMLSAVLLRRITKEDARERRLSPDDLEEYLYVVVDGGRRVADALDSGLKNIPAIITDASSDIDALDTLTVVMNHSRSTNPLEEALALHRVVGEGESKRKIADIAARYGIPRLVLKNLFDIANLHPAFHDAMRENRVKRSIAVEIARLTKAQQHKILEILLAKRGEVLKMDVVKSIKLADKQKAAQSIFAALDLPKAADPVETAIKTLLAAAKGQQLSTSDLVKRIKNQQFQLNAMPEVANDTAQLPDF